jgi:hypothetical protein
MTSESDERPRQRIREKEKIRIRFKERRKLTHRAPLWTRLQKNFKKKRKTFLVLITLGLGSIIALSAVFLSVKEKSDESEKMRNKKKEWPSNFVE